MDLGFPGAWAPAVCSGRGGAAGGVAILASAKVLVTRPPLAESAVLVPGRVVAARAHWGRPAGIVCISVYLIVDVKLAGGNVEIFPIVLAYLSKLNAIGQPWIVGGDFNVDPGGVEDWFHTVR
eukprot:1453133-Pyramimonas_sp.AAC.1